MEEAVMAAASRNGIGCPQSMLVLYCLKPPLQARLIYPQPPPPTPLTYTLNQPCTAFVHKLCDNLVTTRWSFSGYLVVL